MIKFDKREKQWVAGGVILLLSVVTWMVYCYFPLKEKKNEIMSEYARYNDRIQLLNKRRKRLDKTEKAFISKGNDLTHFSKIMVYGESIDDINAETQALFQVFFEKNNITLTSYKVISSTKWKHYNVGRVEFNLMTSMAGIDKILKYIETLDRVVSVESLRINYTGRRANPLRVTLRMETLFLDIGTGKGN